MTSSRQLEAIFPELKATSYEIMSPPDARYNCIAWAAGDQTRWWEPDPMFLCYWPPAAPRKYTVMAYQKAFEPAGYLPCNDAEWEEGFCRIALYAKDGAPTHASRQLSSRFWTSKLGRNVDLSHELTGLSGETYGDVVVFMKRSHPR